MYEVISIFSVGLLSPPHLLAQKPHSLPSSHHANASGSPPTGRSRVYPSLSSTLCHLSPACWRMCSWSSNADMGPRIRSRSKSKGHTSLWLPSILLSDLHVNRICLACFSWCAASVIVTRRYTNGRQSGTILTLEQRESSKALVHMTQADRCPSFLHA